MTEREAFTAMLDRVGVPWRVTDMEHLHEYEADGNTPVPVPDGPIVVIEAGNGPIDGPIDGYSAFFALFHFDPDGALVRVGLWE